MQDKLTKAWTARMSKNPYVDLLTEQHLHKQNWQPHLLLLRRNFLHVGFFLNDGCLLHFQMTLLTHVNRNFTLHIIESVNRHLSSSVCSLLQWEPSTRLQIKSPVVFNLHFHSEPFVDIPCVAFLGFHKVSLAS